MKAYILIEKWTVLSSERFKIIGVYETREAALKTKERVAAKAKHSRFSVESKELEKNG